MNTQKITIETARPDHPEDRKYVLSYRVFTKTQDEAEVIARKMLTAYCTDHPGVLATYAISGLSFEELGWGW